MTTTAAPPPEPLAELMTQLRPRLHRYCARMTGSYLDGEDVVQDALLKATQAFDAQAVRHAEGWLFRIAHNAAMDFLRRRARDESLFSPLPDEALAPSPLRGEGWGEGHTATDQADRHVITRMALRHFMRLPPSQRSATVLFDVLEYSTEEAAQVLDMTVPAFKAALHRGRARLRDIAAEPDDAQPQPLSAQDQQLLALYAQRFNARDFDGLRDLLAEHVQLDLVGRFVRQGKQAVGEYFGRYAQLQGTRVRPTALEGKPALWVEQDGKPGYFIVLRWDDGRLAGIRDFRHAGYGG